MTSIAETYRLIGLAPSVAQLAFAKLCCGEPLTADEARIAIECAGRFDAPAAGFQEVTSVQGRKSGKTEYQAAFILVHRAVSDAEPGEHILVAPSKSDQATIAWRAVVRYLETGFPRLILDVNESSGVVRLVNDNSIKIQSSNFRHLRGPKFKTGIVDEGCFFTSDDAELGFSNPLAFVLDSIVGGMIASASPLLLLQSSAWTKDGIVFQHVLDRKKNPDRLVWQASTLTMNPYANRELMERHRRDRGEAFYQREYMAQFSEGAAAFVPPEDVDAAMSKFPFFPPREDVFHHMALDPGRLRDRFGAAIAHREGDRVVVDWTEEWRPSLFGGLKYADILPVIWRKAREYGISVIASDIVDFGGIEASIPQTDSGVPEFTLEREMSGGQAGAEMCDVTRALFLNHKLVLPDQPGLAAEFKRLGDFLSQGGKRDVRAFKGADDRTRACMLAIYRAFQEPEARSLICYADVAKSPAPRPITESTLAFDDPGPDRWWRRVN